MTIKNWSNTEKPREKLLEKGAGALSNAELLAIIFRSGIKGKNVIDLAREVLGQTGGFRGLFTLTSAVFCKIPGMSMIRYAELQAVYEIHQRYLLENIHHHDILQNSKHTQRFLIAKLRDQSKEVFACLFLNIQNHLIAYEELAHGTLDSAYVYPRELIKRVLHFNAASIILAHNHPSGQCLPSEADLQLTEKTLLAMELIKVKLLDHFIIGEDNIFSFAEQGLI